MEIYSAPEFDQKKLEEVITRYTELRLKDQLLNQEFVAKVKNCNNGHYYLKMLKEQITEELQIGSPAKASDFAAYKLDKDFGLQVDPEGRYNL